MENPEKEVDKKIELKKEKILKWFKDPYNIILSLVLVFAFVIRFYYFFSVGNQPLWWDEAAYGSLAKALVHPVLRTMEVVYSEWLIRPPLIPILWALFLKIRIPEQGIRFFLEFVPSILTVFFVYLVGKEMYNKKIGLIASAIFSVLWIHLFYTLRFLTNLPALPFLFLSIYYFIKTNKQGFNFKYFSLSLFLLSIATLMRFPVGIVFFVYIIIFFLSNKISLLKKPNFWISVIIGITPIIIFFLINLMLFGNIFPALLGGEYLRSPGEKLQGVKNPFHFQTLNFILIYLTTTFFIFFLWGLGIVLFELFIGYNFILKNKKLQNHLLLLLILILINSFFIFYLRASEDRWLFPTSLTMVCFSAIGIISLYDFIKKHSKYLALIVVLGVLFFGAYAQISIADGLIKNRKDSFLHLRTGFEWIKENTEQDSIISGSGIEVYSVYYGERAYLALPANESDIINIEKNADYLVVHGYTVQASYLNDYLQKNQDKWQPINAFFLDPQTKQQPILVIYKNIQKN